MSNRQGNRIVGVKRTFATAKRAQTISDEVVVVTLPSVGATYRYEGKRLYRDGAPIEVRS